MNIHSAHDQAIFGSQAHEISLRVEHHLRDTKLGMLFDGNLGVDHLDQPFGLAFNIGIDITQKIQGTGK